MTVTHDIRYAGRALRRAPAFTLTARLSLAIGIAVPVVVLASLLPARRAARVDLVIALRAE